MLILLGNLESFDWNTSVLKFSRIESRFSVERAKKDRGRKPSQGAKRSFTKSHPARPGAQRVGISTGAVKTGDSDRLILVARNSFQEAAKMTDDTQSADQEGPLPDASEGQGTDPINPQLNPTNKEPRTESETPGPIGCAERPPQRLTLP